MNDLGTIVSVSTLVYLWVAMWILLGLFSAVFLGFYDISKKYGVRSNAVLPVLFLGTLFGLLVMVPSIIGSIVAPEFFKKIDMYVPEITWSVHALIFIKSAIISVSWIFDYFAIKNLPITIVAPIRASGPFVTLIGAVLFLGERPTGLQWVGLGLILTSFFAMSRVGRAEGIEFRSNRWILFVLFGTIANAMSGLYDKYLIQISGIHPQIVQVWFAWYLVVILGIVTLIFWFPKRKETTPFQWRWSIPLIGVLLIIADFIYFRALTYDDALISVLSPLKRSRAFIALIIGGILFKEVNKRKKLFALSGVFAGVVLIVYST